jgi:hypothetical protein
MRGGIGILAFFATAWCAMGLRGGDYPWSSILVPVAISAALLFWGNRQARALRPDEQNSNRGRLVGIWSAVEGVAIFIAANACVRMGAPGAIGPVIAIIVGLHFLPLARGLPLPLYYLTGAALVLDGVAVLLLVPAPQQLMVTGFVAAVILWASCAALIARDRVGR